MEIHKVKTAFTDDRGEIIDLIQKEEFDAVTLIKSNKGAIRGNHYHKLTTQYSYVLSGKVSAYSCKPGMNVENAVLEPGDMMVSKPYESHALHAVENCEILIITKGPRNGEDYEDDTYRVDPLHLT